MQEQSGARFFTVFGPKRAQMDGIAESRPDGSFDLYGQELPALLDHQIHFLAAGGSPIPDFGALEAGVSPHQQIVQDNVLKVRTGEFFGLG